MSEKIINNNTKNNNIKNITNHVDDIDYTLNHKTRVGVVGYRYYNNYEIVKNVLDQFNSNKPIDLIISGGCVGVDTLAERYAKEHNIPIKIFLPNLNYGIKGFAIRDQQIVNLATDIIAFPSHKGKGTQITINMAQKKSINTQVHYID